MDDSACGRTLRAGQRTIIADVEVDAPYAPFRSVARAAGYRAVQSTPLIGRDGALLGILSTHWRSPHQTSEQDLRRLDLYVRQAADFIEHIRVETALRQSEERFRVALQNTPIVVFNQDRDLRYTWIHNPKFGYSVDDILGKTDHDLNDPETAAALTELKQQVLASGISRRQEVRAATPAGEAGYYDLTLEPMRDESGQVVGITAAVFDITKLKQSEAALRESEARFRGVVESNMVGILFWDASDCITDGNEMAVQMLGYSQEELRSGQLRWLDITPPEFHKIDAAMQNQLLIEGVCPPFEKAYIRKDGTQVPILIGGALIPGYSDRAVAYFLDITDRVQLERDRERILQQEQAAREAAEAANRIKDEFLAILSHELRSPLNPILGWTKLLQSHKFDATKTAAALATIERNVNLQTQLIDDLLDVAKILHGKLSMRTAPVDLTFVIEAAIDSVSAAAVAKEIHLCSVLPQIGQVSGDATRLQQIIWNLLSNAIKFTPTKGQVEIRLARVDTQAQITVSDTGKGINPDFLPHIFESFRQEDTSTTRKYGGLGLGLAIVRHLVEAHGGTICVDSPGEGQGATFTVQLPLLDSQLAQSSSEVISLDDLDLKGMRVLAVDDDPDARELLNTLLMQFGAEVLIVTSAAEVLAHLDSFQPDVLISDIGMPEVNGYTLIRQIRALPPDKGGQIPAIALTAYASEGDSHEALDSGYQQHITKPLDPAVLVRALIPFI